MLTVNDLKLKGESIFFGVSQLKLLKSILFCICVIINTKFEINSFNMLLLNFNLQLLETFEAVSVIQLSLSL